jgi:acyl-CoA ligase (AMP-forming) (exosortase A-associated)
MSEPVAVRRPAAAPVRFDQLVRGGDPGRPAVTFKDRTLDYGELSRQITRAASGLRALGIRRGDRVAVYAEKRLETVVAMFAVSAAGAVLVPLNPLFKERHVQQVVTDCGARAVVTTAERLRTVGAALGADTGVEHLICVGAAAAAAPAADGGTWRVTGWDEVASGPAEPPTGAESAANTVATVDTDIAAIFYTSGSTGGPKGVVLSHRNLIAGAESVAGYLGHTADDIVLSALPLSFDAGFSQLTTTFVSGAHVVLTNYLVPRDIVRLCARHQVTALTCVPPLWLELAGLEWPAESTRSLRYFANTGGRMPKTALDRLRALFPQAAPYLMYGLTEAFRSTYLDPAEVDRRPDSIGRAIPNAEVLVVRPDGTPCDPGEHGELVHRGALVSLGYWNDPERTAQRFRPAPGTSAAVRPELAVWSGDTAYRDEDGFLYFVGRTDEMIKSSGYRISPAEIEEAAYATGMVGEAVALGMADDRLGHSVVLVVDGPCDTELLGKALAQALPRYMLPRRTVVLGSLPRSVNGKFDRPLIRRTIEEGPR